MMAQAPTGIGKTLACLFPTLKAAPAQQIDKVFFLSAKTPGRGLALDALEQLRATAHGGQPLRVLELVARDKACEHPDKACHGESCPLARGFYDRLPQARQAAILAAQAGLLNQACVRDTARSHQVCPYYLSQDLARWADVVVGDYNYYFDISAMLYSLAQFNQWRVAVLADEAHNLVERGRKMYSAELDQVALSVVRKSAPAPLKKPLDALQKQWLLLAREQEADYQAYDTVPEKLLLALQKFNAAVGDYMTEHADDPAVSVDSKLLEFYFDTLLFTELGEAFGQHSLFDISKEPGRYGKDNATLCLRNILPAPFLAPRFAAAHSVVLFSATLSPWHFYADTLGLPPDTPWMDVESPFKPEQLAVKIAGNISTRYRDRDVSLAPIVELMAQQYQAQAGNYLAFFSSFDYLQQVWSLFRERCPDVPAWEQSRGMEEGARAEFLARFTENGKGIGFAVLGGAFGEGIDLPGKKLIGAFVATLGLPQLNSVNEQMRERMEAIFGQGYDYTYLFPGLQKVVQAAGRVIRTQDDRGVLYLIDDRYGRGEVRKLLPRWWKLERV
jgi:Rad3-related DNA helicase